jgi:hypothetical protein
MTIDPTVTDLTDRAAQAVHELNHRTRRADAFTGPAQLYRLVGDLSLLTGMLPQLLGQLEDWLNTEHDADRIRSDNQGDPEPVVCAATTYLADAGDTAHDLADLLKRAQRYLATLGAAAPRHDPNGNPGRRAKDLADQAAGRRDEQGRPAPWPDYFHDDDIDWCIGGIDDDDPPVAPAPGEAPF